MAVFCNIYADSGTILDTIKKNAGSLGLNCNVTDEHQPYVELRNEELPEPLVIRVSEGGIWASYKNKVKPTPKDRVQEFLRTIRVVAHLHDATRNPDKYFPLENHERTFKKYMNKVLDGLQRGSLQDVLGGGD